MSNTETDVGINLTQAVEVAMEHGLSRATAMTIVTRVAPSIERAVRDRIAADIENRRAAGHWQPGRRVPKAWGAALTEAGRIARGEPQP